MNIGASAAMISLSALGLGGLPEWAQIVCLCLLGGTSLAMLGWLIYLAVQGIADFIRTRRHGK